MAGVPDESIQRRKLLVERAERKLKKILSNFDGELVSVIDELTYKLDSDPSGITGSVRNIDRVNKLGKVFNEINEEYSGKIVENVQRTVRDQLKALRRYFDEVTGGNAATAQFERRVKNVMQKKIGIAKNGGTIPGGMLDGIIGKDNALNTLRSEAMQAVTSGNVSARKLRGRMRRRFGSGYGMRSSQIYMEVMDVFSQNDRQIAKEGAEEFDLKFYMYTGGIIDSSRDFCRERNGNVYTEAEIEAWSGLDWGSKTDPYDPFRDLGGYNCRHLLSPISKELAFTLRPELKHRYGNAA